MNNKQILPTNNMPGYGKVDIAAMTAMSRLIESNKDNIDKNLGIPLDNYLHII